MGAGRRGRRPITYEPGTKAAAYGAFEQIARRTTCPSDDPIMLLRAFGVWCGFVLMAVINGAVRESVLSPRLGAVSGGQLSAILLAIMIQLVTYFSIRWIAPGDSRDAWRIGFCWLLLVLLFEFGFGRAQGMSWSAMLGEYRFWAGKLWVLVLLSATTAPLLAGRLRRLV